MYDDDNNLIQSLGYLADGRLFSKELYTYDSVGNVIEQINSVSRFTYAYDNYGNMIELAKYARDFNTSIQQCIPSPTGSGLSTRACENLTSEYVYRPDSSVKAKSTFEYDAKGNITLKRNISAKGA